MVRNGAPGFRGYIVRVRTKQGLVYRHRNLRLVIDGSRQHGLSLQTHRLADPSSVSGDVGVTPDSSADGAIAWRSYSSKDSGKKASWGRGFGGRYRTVEETTLDEFVDLARTGEGEASSQSKSTGGPGHVNVADLDDDEQVAKLYSLGILYDGPAPADSTGETAAASSATPNTNPDDTASPYQADSLETIRHAEPLYTVRHVVAKRKGKRVVGSSAAKSPLKVEKTSTGSKRPEDKKDEVANGEGSSGSVPPLYALNGVWEDGEGQTINGSALWNELEEFEYVVLADDDLASMAGSWVELESVLGTDDGE